MKKEESKLQRETRQAIEDEFGGFWFKVHGGLFQRAGVPDLLGCLYGFYIGVEMKTEGGKTSGIQKSTMRLIRKAGGLAFVSKSVDHTLLRIRKFLIKNGKITKDEALQIAEKGRKLREQRKLGRRVVHGAGDWKDHCLPGDGSSNVAKKRRKGRSRRNP